MGSVLVADHPDFIPGRWYMVNCYAKKGKFAEARKECEAILKLNPEHVQAKEYLVSLDKANAQIYEAAGSRFELTAKKAGFKTAKGKNFTLYTDAGGAKAASLKGDVAVDIDNLMRQFSVDSLGRDLTIYMISTSDAYQRFVTDSIVKAGTPYGFSVSPAGLIVVNLQLGYGTFIHELTHILLYRKFGEVPTWISEGVSSLYESFNVHPDGRVSGGINWRLPILQKVIGTSRYISLKTLLSTDDWSKWWAKPGTAAPTGEARYLMYYLQEKTLLDRFLNEYGSRRKDDPSSIRLLEELLGMPLEKFEPIWQDWVQQLSE